MGNCASVLFAKEPKVLIEERIRNPLQLFCLLVPAYLRLNSRINQRMKFDSLRRVETSTIVLKYSLVYLFHVMSETDQKWYRDRVMKSEKPDENDQCFQHNNENFKSTSEFGIYLEFLELLDNLRGAFEIPEPTSVLTLPNLFFYSWLAQASAPSNRNKLVGMLKFEGLKSADLVDLKVLLNNLWVKSRSHGLEMAEGIITRLIDSEGVILFYCGGKDQIFETMTKFFKDYPKQRDQISTLFLKSKKSSESRLFLGVGPTVVLAIGLCLEHHKLKAAKLISSILRQYLEQEKLSESLVNARRLMSQEKKRIKSKISHYKIISNLLREWLKAYFRDPEKIGWVFDFERKTGALRSALTNLEQEMANLDQMRTTFDYYNLLIGSSDIAGYIEIGQEFQGSSSSPGNLNTVFGSFAVLRGIQVPQELIQELIGGKRENVKGGDERNEEMEQYIPSKVSP